MNQKLFSTLTLVVCLVLLSSVEAFGQQQQRRRSGGLDNLSLPSTGAAIASSSSSWQKFAPEGTGFSVMMPGLPDEDSKELGPGAANLKAYRYKTGETEYVVGVLLDFPAQLLQDPDFRAKYFEVLPQMMMRSREYASRNYKLTAQRNISVNDHPGRQYKLDSEDYACTMRVVLSEHSIYIMSVESAKASFSPENVEKFLASFTLEEN